MRRPQQIGNYRILRELGRGGMGVVYEAEHLRIKSHVAIKVLHEKYAQDPQVVARFKLEAVAANVPRHPGIAQVQESEVLPDEGLPYIIMEYLDGRPLRKRISRRREGLPIAEAIRFGKQIADALAAAHSKKIVHRDIKPENILIVRDDAVPGGERAKILDFGIAAVAAEVFVSESQSNTQVNTGPFAGLLGTAAYMAPEQCQRIGSVPIDDKADVYALGAVLYEMLTGRPPFVAPEAVSVMSMHINQDPVPPHDFRPETPPELDALVLRMLAKAAERRPTMREVSTALTGLEHPESMSQPIVPTTSDRRALLIGLGGLAMCALAGSLYLGLRQAGSDRVSWRIDSHPTGAEIIGPDGMVLGKTPWQERQQRDLGKFVVTLRLPGYQPQSVALDRSESSSRTVELKP